ncbi:uncharacterized protein LOC122397831 [Colletes gigas]|uniref:uncharacterized protein LOC122397831 n=1 Tax=Colletes gigas TaxID=935657 RepID=UPI001C9B9DCD|nr:uncharacterized protein LOC122397831 [Colletes gigas]XP_043253203.1 uncharacterized protein LOC122397831 [Colletes gigas]XP_043253204.1 uncharacterized protein LOC122397831 [Colletes gigas]
MKASSIGTLVAGLFLLCLVAPLQSDPQDYWPSYSVYNPVNPRLHPVEAFPDRYSAPTVQGPPSYVTGYVRVPEETLHAGYYDYQDFGANNQGGGDSIDRMNLQRKEEDAERSSKEQEILKNMNILNKLLSEDPNDKDVDTNAIGGNVMSEETKRVVREVRKQKPGFFWTLARITFEMINDTRSAIKQIGEIVNNSIVPDSATQSSMMSGSLTAVDADRNTTGVNGTETTTTSPTTTTQSSALLTRSGLQTLIRRNVLGLVRLFNIEWKDALNESEVTVREFQKDLGNQVGSFLRDNPNAY